MKYAVFEKNKGLSLCIISEVRTKFRGDRPLHARQRSEGGGASPYQLYEAQNSPEYGYRVRFKQFFKKIETWQKPTYQLFCNSTYIHRFAECFHIGWVM